MILQGEVTAVETRGDVLIVTCQGAGQTWANWRRLESFCFPVRPEDGPRYWVGRRLRFSVDPR